MATLTRRMQFVVLILTIFTILHCMYAYEFIILVGFIFIYIYIYFAYGSFIWYILYKYNMCVKWWNSGCWASNENGRRSEQGARQAIGRKLIYLPKCQPSWCTETKKCWCCPLINLPEKCWKWNALDDCEKYCESHPLTNTDPGLRN